MRVSSGSSTVLSNKPIGKKIPLDTESFLETYDFSDYLKGQSFLDQGFGGFSSPEGVSALQVSPEAKELLKRQFWRTWYHLKHVQAGPFAVYNRPPPIDVTGLFPATTGEIGAPVDPNMVQPVAPPLGSVAVTSVPQLAAGAVVVPQAVGAPQVQLVQGVGPATVTPQIVTAGENKDNAIEDVNKSLDTQAIPTNLPVTASQTGDPNSPPLANVPLVNVIGGKYVSAPGVIPSDVMEKHPLFDSTHLQATDFFKINVENVTRSFIVVAIVVFIIAGVIYRIKKVKQSKKKK